MRRRGFLQCIALSSLAAVLPWQAVPGWQVQGAATHPGAPLSLRVSRRVPAGAQLVVQIEHQRGDQSIAVTEHGPIAVVAGQPLQLVTPYPYGDLVAGVYDVRLLLRDGHGRLLERCSAGQYAIRRVRFSA